VNAHAEGTAGSHKGPIRRLTQAAIKQAIVINEVGGCSWYAILIKVAARADWSTLQSDLMDRVLVLPNECLLPNGAIAFCWDVQSDYVPAECVRQCGRVGFLAWALSGDLRTRYCVPGFNPKTTSWDIEPLLKHYHDEAVRLVAESQATVQTDGDGNESAARASKSREAWAKWRLRAR
jgi:hypothetical protein